MYICKICQRFYPKRTLPSCRTAGPQKQMGCPTLLLGPQRHRGTLEVSGTAIAACFYEVLMGKCLLASTHRKPKTQTHAAPQSPSALFGGTRRVVQYTALHHCEIHGLECSKLNFCGARACLTQHNFSACGRAWQQGQHAPRQCLHFCYAYHVAYALVKLLTCSWTVDGGFSSAKIGQGAVYKGEHTC